MNDNFDDFFRSFINGGGGFQLPGSFNPIDLMKQIQQLFNGSAQPVNWETATETAMRKIAGEPQMSAGDAARVRDALRAAQLWLDPATSISPNSGQAAAWSRKQWVENSIPAWKNLCEPIAVNTTHALAGAIEKQMGSQLSDLKAIAAVPGMPGLTENLGPISMDNVFRSLSGLLYGIRLGEAIGTLASNAFGSCDIGLPITDGSLSALIWANVNEFASDLDIGAEDALTFLALRQSAQARLLGSVPWLAIELENAVLTYATEIQIDEDAIERMVSNLQEGMISMDGLQQSLGDASTLDIFSTKPTPAQTRAAERLEQLLAVSEGWVDEVTLRAGTPYIPTVLPLTEMMRRRKAMGTPVEQMLKILIGLEVSPARSRNAQKLWSKLTDEVGIEGRDRYFTHPDVIPTLEELEDPEHFLEHRVGMSSENAALDDELNSMLDGTLGWAEGLSPEIDSEGDAGKGSEN